MASSVASHSELVGAFRKQVAACRKAGSEYTARLMEACADDLQAGGVLLGLLEDWVGHPILDALVQRVLGAVQQLALEGRAPELAGYMPSLGGRPRWPEAAEAFLAVIERETAALRPRLDEQVQTNEVRRCAALLGGFLEAARSGLPLRLLEFGSSGGLHLFWDRYAYRLGPHRWGEDDAPVVLDCEWRGGVPALEAPVRVASRRGCDLDPLDLRDPERVRRVESFLWSDQVDRHRLLREAAAALPAAGAPIEQSRAGDFLERELAQPSQGVATVVFHCHTWGYLPAAERERVVTALEGAGARASAEAPLFWLRSEPPNLDLAELRLRRWPGGEESLLARAHHHGRWVEWLGLDAVAPGRGS